MPFTPTYPKPGTVWGTDVSFYQDDNETPQKINFEKMFAAGASFTIIRAGQNLWRDDDFVDNWRNSKGILPRGAYFYLDIRASIRQQAKIFAEALKEDRGELPPTVDFEQVATAKVNGIKQQLMIEHLDGFLAYMDEYLPEERRKEIIYTGYYYWLDFGRNQARYAEHPLWIARYKANEPLIPKPWTTWTFWQFADTGDGKKLGVESHAIDLDYFNGTLEELYRLAGWIETPDPSPPAPLPGGEVKHVKVLVPKGSGITVDVEYSD